jgi:squalene-hopene/tetraprenyl-beta-curcumene cyclase
MQPQNSPKPTDSNPWVSQHKSAPLLACAIATFLLIIAIPSPARADDPSPQAQTLIDKGLDFLKTQQKPDHTWQRDSDPPAITAIVLKAFMGDKKYDADMPFLDKGYDALLSFQKDNGGIYKDMLANYNTAIAISSLAAAHEAEYQEPQAKAVAFLKRLQWSDDTANTTPERKSVDDKNVNFGGWGYGKKERADGSNEQIALDALHDARLKPSDPAFQRAVKFVSRLQNNSETNDQSWAGNDGGFIYTASDNGSSPAGEYTAPDGKRLLRSYGSMTYAGLKSLIYAGLSKDDPRVKAAWSWISNNYTMDENPGFRAADPATAASGIFYYYHTLSRCLNAYDSPTITDSKGQSHDWRAELITKLASIQKPDGSWVGDKRWMEDSPVLVTAYCVISLEEAKQDLIEHSPKQ